MPIVAMVPDELHITLKTALEKSADLKKTLRHRRRRSASCSTWP